MGLKEILEKMKLVELEGTDEQEAPKPGARAPAGGAGKAAGDAKPLTKASATTIDEILRTLPPPPKIDERSAIPSPSGPGSPGSTAAPDFASIYRAAGVTDPPHGYSIYKVMEIFASEGMAGLDTKAKAAALAGFLRMNPSGPVAIKDVVQDAIRRDQTLDSYEDFFRKKLGKRASQVDKENADLQAELDEVTRRNREKMDANRLAMEQERRSFSEWQALKRLEERKLFEAVAPFVESNPVTLSTGGTDASGDAAPRVKDQGANNQT